MKRSEKVLKIILTLIYLVLAIAIVIEAITIKQINPLGAVSLMALLIYTLLNLWEIATGKKL